MVDPPNWWLIKLHVIENPIDISNIFNQHFVNIGPTLSASVPSSNADFRNYVNQENSTFELKRLSQDEVLEIINNLQNNKASGLDKIPVNLLKLSSRYVFKSLTHIFHLSLDTGILHVQYLLIGKMPE